MRSQQQEDTLNRYYADLLRGLHTRGEAPVYTGPLKELKRWQRFALVAAWLLVIAGIVRCYVEVLK